MVVIGAHGIRGQDGHEYPTGTLHAVEVTRQLRDRDVTGALCGDTVMAFTGHRWPGTPSVQGGNRMCGVCQALQTARP